MDLPEPFGPTTQVIPGSKRSVVAEAKDLNPRRVMALRCTPPDSTARCPEIAGGAVPPGRGAMGDARRGPTGLGHRGFIAEYAGHIRR
ncbi:hypothetical protein SCWH03_17030 [Streptomyces pacificus]|uniref:Uncharacterized protein n=1 Tax=Streptomyces pacificus TaxID=2705029 RepID=A0A6A0AV87_9ACTN|nr:hypothetical protein SCWH03_17030 [Streptomyces pacificus]